MTYICFVDKSYGDAHSFVDGMLQGALLSKYPDTRVYFYRSGEAAGDACSPFSRKGFGRLLHPFWCAYKVRAKIQRGVRGCTVFVRNEFLVLLILCVVRRLLRWDVRVCFQSSFPHELYSGSIITRAVSRAILRVCLPRIERIYVVSEAAKERLARYLGSSTVSVDVIPLCTDFVVNAGIRTSSSRGRRFVYIGTFSASRSLDALINAFVEVLDSYNGSCFLTFYGGDKTDFLKEYPALSRSVNALEQRGVLQFCGRISRENIPEALNNHDVGLNYVPIIPMYVESSSTKLGEYLGSGLPVISTAQIPYHEYIHGLGNVGWLVADDSVAALVSLIHEVLHVSEETLAQMSVCAGEVARRNLNYHGYLDLF